MRRSRISKRKIIGTGERPRLSVFRGTNNISAQMIDDDLAITLAPASTLDPKLKKKIKNGGNIEAARMVGEEVAKRALEKGIKKAVFDRGGSLYHGRVKALADAARAAGLQF